MVNRFAAITASRTLKVAGLVCILSFFLDFVILLFPFQPTERGWQISLATALVDRGIVPLVGLGMLFAAYWADSMVEDDRSGFDLRMPAMVISCVLGLMFLLIFPLHLNNVRQASAQTIEDIGKQAEQEENQLNSQLNQFLGNAELKAALEQRKAAAKKELTDIINNEAVYKQRLEDPNVPAQTKELLKRFKQNPAEIDKFLDEQANPQLQAAQQKRQIREQRERREKAAQDQAFKSGLRIGVSSLSLAIGYIIIGWTGLRSMGVAQGSGRKATAR